MTSPPDIERIKKNLAFIKAHPEYEEMPASIREFLGPEYLNFTTARPGLVEALVEIFGEEFNPDRISSYERAMFTGAIGIGKTTFASLAIPYMVHVTLCLRNPQEFYGLGPGSRIAFMQMSTSEKKAVEVTFGDLKARIDHSLWFVNKYPYDTAYKKQMRFPKDIWILPGGSEETQFEGYNILGGILDEMDSHKISENKDYADVGYETIHSRIASRFPDFSDVENQGHRGLLICIGQMKKATGFGMRKYKEFLKDDKAYVKRQTIWESFGWDKFTRADGTRASFWYNQKTKQIIPRLLADKINSENLIEIPNAFKKDFENHPEKALRDLAGIPPTVEDAFMSLIDRIEACSQRWVQRYNRTSPVKPNPSRIEFESWFKGGVPVRHHVHIDFAKSAKGDALGMALGHIEEMVEIDGERKPHIVIDALMRIKASAGTEIIFQDVRNIIYYLKDELGFRITSVTMDGYQSTDTYQQLRKRKYKAEELSVDKSYIPYEDVRDAIYERRLDFPPYMTYLNRGDTLLVEIAVQELSQLVDDGKKIDHPEGGSKDVADGIAGVVTSLMGDRSYRRGVRSASDSTSRLLDEDEVLESTGTTGSNGLVIPLFGNGMKAPVPPHVGSSGLMGLTIPQRLRPPGER
jgi:hypothetical protein